MKTLAKNEFQLRAEQCGQARIVILAFVCFVLGVGAGALWFSRPPTRQVTLSSIQPEQAAVATPVDGSIAAVPSPQLAEPVDPAAIEAVQRAIPNVTLVSVEQGALILRKAAVAEFQQAAQELQARQKKAEQRFIEGQGRQSAEEQIIAAKELQHLQAEQMDTLKRIAANSESRIDALKQLKGQPR